MKRYNSPTRLQQLTKVEKVCRYLLEMTRCKIKNLLQQMIDVYFSNEIEDDVGSGGDSASFMFSKGAMGLAVGPEGLFRIETERNASFRSTEYVATGFWGEVESKDAFGVYILHDVS